MIKTVYNWYKQQQENRVTNVETFFTAVNIFVLSKK